MQKYSFLLVLLAALAFVGLSNATLTIPSGIQYYVAVNITNSQTTATPSPFQQMINITESTFGNYIAYNKNFANFEYFYANGTIIPAWIESNSSGKLITWVKLTPSIPANGKLTIYLGFASKTTNLLSSSGTSGIGEAPQLSSTYGQYDDGASVFTNYWNFAGTTLPSSLTAEGATGEITINNGITFSGSSDVLVRSTSAISYPQITDALIQTSTSAAYPGVVIGEATTTTMLGSQAWLENGYSWDYYNGAWRLEYISPSAGRNIVSQVSANMVAGDVYSIVWVAVGNEKTYINYVNQINGADTTVSSIGNYYAYLGFDTSGTTSFTAQWLRTRAYPPNGVMPSVSFGSVQQTSGASLTISPNPATYGQSITITATCLVSTDTCAIDYPSLGTHIAEGTGTATYTYNAFALGAGTYSYFYANDLTAGTA